MSDEDRRVRLYCPICYTWFQDEPQCDCGFETWTERDVRRAADLLDRLEGERFCGKLHQPIRDTPGAIVGIHKYEGHWWLYAVCEDGTFVGPFVDRAQASRARAAIRNPAVAHQTPEEGDQDE